MSLGGLERQSVRRVFRLRLGVHHLEYALRARERGLQHGDLVGQVVDGHLELAGVLQKRLDHAHRADRTRHHQIAANARHQREADVPDDVHQGADATGKNRRLGADFRQFLVRALEIFHHVLFAAKDLHNLRARDRLFHHAIQFAERGLLLLEEAARVLGDAAQHKHAQRNREAGDDRELPAQGKHHGKRDHHGDDAGKHLRERVGKHIGNIVHIVGQAAHQLAVRFGIEKTQWQLLQALEQIRADDAHRMLRHIHQQQRLPQRAQPAAQVQQEHKQHRIAQRGHGIGCGERHAAPAGQGNEANGHALERKADHAFARGVIARELIREKGGARKGGGHAHQTGSFVHPIVVVQNVDHLAGNAGRDQCKHGGRHQQQ